MLCIRFRCACFVAICLASAEGLPAQNIQEEVSRLRESFRDAPLAFAISGGSTGTEKLELVEQPILNWSNPERRTPAGALYLWTLQGRPQVAMGLYPTAEKTIDHEFQSLSPFPLRAVRSGTTVWEPSTAGVETKPLTQAAEPSETRTARLRQMRAIAKQFTAILAPPRGNPIQLRLLTTPLYRYPDAQSSEIVDGAIFGFVHGTDPEVLLVIEAVDGSSNDLKWRYGLARMTIVPIEVSYRQRPVWKIASAWLAQTLSTPYLVVKEE